MTKKRLGFSPSTMWGKIFPIKIRGGKKTLKTHVYFFSQGMSKIICHETFNTQTYNSTNGIHDDLKLKLGMLKITTSNSTTEYVGIDQTKFEGGRDPVSYSVSTGSVTIEAEFSEQYYIAQTSKKRNLKFT